MCTATTHGATLEVVYLFQNLRVRDQINTLSPNYFAQDEVEECEDNSGDKNEPDIDEIVTGLVVGAAAETSEILQPVLYSA